MRNKLPNKMRSNVHANVGKLRSKFAGGSASAAASVSGAVAPEAIAINAERDPVQHCIAGMAAQEAGRADEAIAHYQLALELAPQLLDVRLLLAFALGTANRKPEGQAVVEATPNVEQLSSVDKRRLADAAIELNATTFALGLVRTVLESSPDDATLHATYGALLQRDGKMDDASLVLHRAHLRWPTHVPVLVNRARILVEQGAYAEAATLYSNACSLDPRNDSARSSRSLLCLMMGDFVGGWRDHEARRTQAVHTVAVPRGIKAWDGKNANGKTLLMWGEQGLGDQIQGVRFAAQLSALGARVVVRCHKALVRLFVGARGVSAVVADGEPLPACDAHVPMLSVPALLGLHSEGDFGSKPYLNPTAQPSPVLVNQFNQLTNRLSSSHWPRIGVAWAGSPGHSNDHNRSLPVELLPSLIGDAPVQWVSLQTGPRASDVSALSPDMRSRVHQLDAQFADFVDTAHVLRSLDLVVSVDTSVAHIAGAMGIPTLLLLPFVPDWRWQLSRDDSPWYGSVRILRQPTMGNWDALLEQTHRALAVGGFARAA